MDEVTSYDRRFYFRGPQKSSPDVIILNLTPQDFSQFTFRNIRTCSQFEELADITDSIYWDRRNWYQLLKRILSYKPKSIGITLFLPDSLGPLSLTDEELRVFRHPSIFWSGSRLGSEQVLRPLFGEGKFTNWGSNEVTPDEDGRVRRVFGHLGEAPILAEKVTGRLLPKHSKPPTINYRGAASEFQHLRVEDLDTLPNVASVIEGKILLIGTANQPRFITPTGIHNRAEIMAQITDNLLENRWPHRAGLVWYAFILLAILILSIAIIFRYPQMVAFFILAWLGILIASVSAWSFDTYYFWIPVLSPLVALVVSWVVFLGYQVEKSEELNWKLLQEQRNLQELENLKNNFVSLISHDLKTPIAKIQAVTDRLLSQESSEKLHSDLSQLRKYNEELNRYIQSILSLLRVESKDFQIRKEVCDVNELIQEAAEALKPLASEKNQSLLTQLDPLFTIEADPTLIKEVLINLIDNAIKYSPEGALIWIKSEEVEDRIFVTVQDDGPGIPSEEIHLLWQKFTRGKDQELKSKGTGLGLYLVKYFIELHGGTVEIESQVQKGTQVRFSLPIED